MSQHHDAKPHQVVIPTNAFLILVNWQCSEPGLSLVRAVGLSPQSPCSFLTLLQGCGRASPFLFSATVPLPHENTELLQRQESKAKRNFLNSETSTADDRIKFHSPNLIASRSLPSALSIPMTPGWVYMLGFPLPPNPLIFTQGWD